MRAWIAVLGLVACSGGSSEGDAPPSGEAVAPATAVALAKAADDPSVIPEDWVWVTDTRGQLEVAMPGLPRSLTSREPSAADERVLVVERGGAAYSIVSKPAATPTALEELERSLGAAGAVSQRAPWREHGLGLTLATAAGPVRVRAMVQDDRLYSLEVSGSATVTDAERFFGSLGARATPLRGPLHDAQRGYRVEAPTRMGRWLDVAGLPPLVGHRAVFDGNQLSVNVNDLLLVPDPQASLDGSVTQMRREFGGELVEIDPRPFGGRPSRRLELRARDGMYATIRLMLDGSRLYQAAVYAPSGREAPWADAYVDSLVVGE